MKRKQTITALLMVVTMLAVSMLTGCAPKLPTAEDAQNYTKAVLDLMCTGDYDHSVSLSDVEEGKELETRDAMIDDALRSIAGDAGLTDDVTAEFKDVLIEAFAKCKYTIGEAVETGEGEYDVTVAIEPLKLFAGVQTRLMEQSATLFDDVEDPGALSEQEYNSRIYSLMAKLIKENLQEPVYEDAKEVVVHYGLLDKENNLYGISEEDGSKLGEVLFSTSLE